MKVLSVSNLPTYDEYGYEDWENTRLVVDGYLHNSKMLCRCCCGFFIGLYTKSAEGHATLIGKTTYFYYLTGDNAHQFSSSIQNFDNRYNTISNSYTHTGSSSFYCSSGNFSTGQTNYSGSGSATYTNKTIGNHTYLGVHPNYQPYNPSSDLYTYTVTGQSCTTNSAGTNCTSYEAGPRGFSISGNFNDAETIISVTPTSVSENLHHYSNDEIICQNTGLKAPSIFDHTYSFQANLSNQISKSSVKSAAINNFNQSGGTFNNNFANSFVIRIVRSVFYDGTISAYGPKEFYFSVGASPTGYVKIWLSRKLYKWGNTPSGQLIDLITPTDLSSIYFEIFNAESCDAPNLSSFFSVHDQVFGYDIFDSNYNNYSTLGYSILYNVEKYSFFPDYEPDRSDPTNPQPNGFPDQNWSPAPP